MLGSAHDGEVAAAARRADVLVKDAGLTCPEALQILPRWQEPETTEEAFDLCLLWRHRLTEWEAGFVSSIARDTSITAKQRDLLFRIAAKIGRLARAGA
jgi:hypothetical protein